MSRWVRFGRVHKEKKVVVYGCHVSALKSLCGRSFVNMWPSTGKASCKQCMKLSGR